MKADRRHEYYLKARPFAAFLEEAVANRDLWHSIARRAQLQPDQLLAARGLASKWHLLVLLEDWCGDAVNTIPVLARLAEEVPGLELRVLRRDENLALMNEHLSHGSRSVPVVMLLDAGLVERAWWGSRPAELQQWIDTFGQSMSKEVRYREARRWYARDHGRSAVGEILFLLSELEGAMAA